MAGEAILIVDDDPSCVTLLRDVLSHHGYRVHGTPTGEDACDAVRAGLCPAVVLMDIQMPGMGGIAAIRALRALPGSERARIIAMTASVMPHELAPLQGVEIDTFQTKPLDIARLLVEVRRLIDAS
jgi:two-component system, cell cycle response regulator DivK